jgi:hypothetical protein
MFSKVGEHSAQNRRLIGDFRKPYAYSHVVTLRARLWFHLKTAPASVLFHSTMNVSYDSIALDAKDSRES